MGLPVGEPGPGSAGSGAAMETEGRSDWGRGRAKRRRKMPTSDKRGSIVDGVTVVSKKKKAMPSARVAGSAVTELIGAPERLRK